MSSRPPGALREPGSGRGMHAEAPSPARSNDRSSGSSSSQPVSGVGRGAARTRGREVGGEERVGHLPRDDRLRHHGGLGGRGGRLLDRLGASSVSVSMPALRSMSRLSDRASSETTASSESSARSAGSRTAVFARVVAMSSRRLSFSVRRESLMVSSARTRARSSRSIRATAWNFVRVDGRDPAAAQGGLGPPRTAWASTDMTSSRLRPRRRFPGAPWRALVWGWPRRATYLLRNARQGTAGHRAAGGVSQWEPGRFPGDSHWAAGPRRRGTAGSASPVEGDGIHRARRPRRNDEHGGSGSISIIPPGDRWDTRRREIDHPPDDGPASRCSRAFRFWVDPAR